MSKYIDLAEQLHDQYRMFPAQHLPGNGSLADRIEAGEA